MIRFLIPLSLLVIWGVLSLLFLGLSALVYVRLTDELPIASVYFEKIDKMKYTAYVSEARGERKKQFDEYEVLGDQWRIDARFLKLRPWANVLGFDARYSLERFEGRYTKIEDQNSMPKLAHDLGEEKLLRVPEFFIKYNMFIDAEYGSSAYKEIDTSSFYTVYRTQFGIIIREEPRPEYTLPEKPDAEPSFFEKLFSMEQGLVTCV